MEPDPVSSRPVARAMPLPAYRPRHYDERGWRDVRTGEAIEIENEDAPVTTHANSLSSSSSPLTEIIVPHPALVAPPSHYSLSALPATGKPLPFAYLPDSSPTKRAWMAATGQQPSTVQKTQRPRPKPVEDKKENSLFAEFVRKLESQQESSVASQPGRPSRPLRGDANVPYVPTASPLGDILFEIRQKRSARETSSSQRITHQREDLSPSIAHRTRSRSRSQPRSRSRSRSHSRSHSRTRARSAEASPSAPSRPTTKNKSVPDDEIDVDLLQRYLKPLGLSIGSLHQLSAASIQAIADAVATNSLEPVLPKPSVAIRGRPRSKLVQQVVSQEAARKNRRHHLAAHTRREDESARAFAAEHPSVAELRQMKPFRSQLTTASGGEGLPPDPAAVRAAQLEQEARQRAAEARARQREEGIRVEDEEDPSALDEQPPPPPPPPRNLPLQLVAPPALIEQLLRNLAQGGGEDPTFKPAASVSASPPPPPDRSASAVRVRRAEVYAASVAPRLTQLTRARQVQVFDEIVRAENLSKIARDPSQSNAAATARPSLTPSSLAPSALQPAWALTEEFAVDGELPADPAASVIASHARSVSRSRSLSRVRTRGVSVIDSGLRLKPGTVEHQRRADARDAKRRTAEAKAAEEEKARLEAKRAAIAQKTAERKRHLRQAKKKAAEPTEAPTPSTFSFALPIPSANPPFSTSANTTAAPTLSQEDEYAANEFGDGSSGVAAPSSANEAPPPTTNSHSLLASVAAVAGISGGETKSSSSKKRSKKRASSKKKKKSPIDLSIRDEAPSARKPPVPSFQFPAPATTNADAREIATNHDSSSTAPAVSVSVSASPAVPSAVSERAQRQSILASQKRARQVAQRQQAKAKADADQRRIDNLRSLHKTCNEVARPKSAAAASASARRSRSQSRVRSASRSPNRRRSASEEALAGDSERVIDAEVARAIAEHDLAQVASTNRTELARLEEKMNHLLVMAGDITSESRRRTSRLRREHERGIKGINSLQRKFGGSVSPSRSPSTRRRAEPARATLQVEPSDEQSEVTADATPRTATLRVEIVASAPTDVPITTTPVEVTAEPAPVTRGRVSRSMTPTPEEEGVSNETQVPSEPPHLDDTNPSDELALPSPTSVVAAAAALPPPAPLVAASPDPRLAGVCNLAQQLSTRFSTLISRLNDKDPDSLRQIVVDAAVQQGEREQQAAGWAREDGDTRREPETDGTSSSPAVTVSTDPQVRAEVSSQVRASIVPPVHLQQPYDLIAPDSTVHPPSLPPTNSVLLPAEMTHVPVPASVGCVPLPHANISPHALLFVEHVPSAPAFLSSLPSPHAEDATPLVFSFTPHARPPSARPYYDLAKREYEVLQQRIQQEKERMKIA